METNAEHYYRAKYAGSSFADGVCIARLFHRLVDWLSRLFAQR